MLNSPIALLAFANDKQDNVRYLRNLDDELREVRETLEGRGIEVRLLPNASLEDIVDEFQKYKERIVIFHYGGHADGFHLFLELEKGTNQVIHAGGLISFLAEYKDTLKLVFINACATKEIAEGLESVGIPATIATYSSINDSTAADLAVAFYKGLVDDISLDSAWTQAVSQMAMKDPNFPAQSRGLFRKNKNSEKRFEWDIWINEKMKDWQLPKIDKTMDNKNDNSNFNNTQIHNSVTHNTIHNNTPKNDQEKKDTGEQKEDFFNKRIVTTISSIGVIGMMVLGYMQIDKKPEIKEFSAIQKDDTTIAVGWNVENDVDIILLRYKGKTYKFTESLAAKIVTIGAYKLEDEINLIAINGNDSTKAARIIKGKENKQDTTPKSEKRKEDKKDKSGIGEEIKTENISFVIHETIVEWLNNATVKVNGQKCKINKFNNYISCTCYSIPVSKDGYEISLQYKDNEKIINSNSLQADTLDFSRVDSKKITPQ